MTTNQTIGEHKMLVISCWAFIRLLFD